MNKENPNDTGKQVELIYKNPKYFIKCNNKDGGIGFLALTGNSFRVFANPTPPVMVFDEKQPALDIITKHQLNFNKNGTSFEVLDSNEVCALDIQIKPYQPIYYIKNQAERRLCSDSTKGYHFKDVKEDFCMWVDEDGAKEARDKMQQKFKGMQISIGRVKPLQPLEESALDKLTDKFIGEEKDAAAENQPETNAE